jgi:Ca2+-transporting ATPase
MRRPIPDTIISLLSEHENGLSEADVVTRRAYSGRNDIIEKVPGSFWQPLLDAAKDPMLWFLVVSSMLFIVLGDIKEAIILLIAVIPLVGMDFYLHHRTTASTAGLRTLLASRAIVIRDGKEQNVAADELVPGDLVLVKQGEPFPADGILVQTENVQVDESALTGEAWPVHKYSIDSMIIADHVKSLDGQYWGMAGTRILSGAGSLRITHTGRNTLYGEIVRSATNGEHSRTPLQQAIAQLVIVLLIAAASICLILAVVRLHQGYGLIDALLSAVTLAVAALPEEFPVVFTFFLGVGVHRLARHKALVRRAVAVENIGRISAICSDKTGTITEGKLTLTHHMMAPDITADQLLRLAALASRSESGDPLDTALLADAPDISSYTKIETIPFTEDRKRETSIIRDSQGKLFAVTKGAPETILSMCGDDPKTTAKILRAEEDFAAGGHKVIASAWRELDGNEWPGGEPHSNYRMAGLVALEDPVREEVAAAVKECQQSGIKVLMVTGDHPVTATAIAREIGLGQGNPNTIEAEILEQQLDNNANFSLEDIDVVARAVPAQKLRLVRRLQQEGKIVAVTGDGVNDVPALQAADIGIAMGERGTRSAREVSAIILLDDNFRTIIRAIAEGRQLFRNLQLSFAWLLMVHIPLVFTAALIPLLGYQLLYLPVHIVWLELIIHPTALLVFQQLPKRTIVHMRPQHGSFFTASEWLNITTVGILLTVIITATYLRSFGDQGLVDHGRTMALLTLILSSTMLTVVLSGMRSRIATVIIAISVIVSAILIQVPEFASRLHISPLHMDDWAIAFVSALLVALIPLAGVAKMQR